MKKKRILLVEDDASIGFLMKEHLSELGSDYEVQSVASGEEALKETEQQSWDLVVTDNRMPGISGIELIETLRDKAPATLTILITGYGSDEVQQKAQQLKVYHYMTKPFPLADLSRVIKDALTLRPGDNNNGSSNSSPTAPSNGGTRQAIKVILAGDGAVGKSSLIFRLCTDRFDIKRTMTIGVEFHIYDVKNTDATTRLIVWDVGGQDHFAFTRKAFYRGSKAVGLVYDTSNHQSFDRLAKWKNELKDNLPNAPIVLAGNKTDLSRQVAREEGQQLAKTWNVPFFETSCLSGNGVRDFFKAVADAADYSLQSRA